MDYLRADFHIFLTQKSTKYIPPFYVMLALFTRKLRIAVRNILWSYYYNLTFYQYCTNSGSANNLGHLLHFNEIQNPISLFGWQWGLPEPLCKFFSTNSVWNTKCEFAISWKILRLVILNWGKISTHLYHMAYSLEYG